ncbi:MAG TPA: hypothetical protein VN638_01085 [Nitrospiraceae bacterium]|nr:hypothetical protein [Nitrospiraceae bacterium]
MHLDLLTVTILDHLNEQTVISLDTLVYLMPQYTWNQVFHCVDQLTRYKMVVLRRYRFEYMLFSLILWPSLIAPICILASNLAPQASNIPQP